MVTTEKERKSISGWFMLAILLIAGAALAFALHEIVTSSPEGPHAGEMALWVIATGLWSFMMGGFFTLQPNMAAVLTLFGKYTGTVKENGFHWANPLLKKSRVSLRARNLNNERIKVNDSRGNPIEIAAVIVWRVSNTAQALFDVDEFVHYVSVQSESALRHLASADHAFIQREWTGDRARPF